MLDLRPPQLELQEAIALELSQISGVVAVVVGGSHARGSARPDSDLDVGIYYCEKAEPNTEKVRDCAKRFSLPDRPPIAFFLLQALFALNGEYYFGDKGAVEASVHFGKQPTQFPARLQNALASPLPESPQLKSAVRILEDLWHEVVDLTGGSYTPKFGL